jgi:hypothetical protein
VSADAEGQSEAPLPPALRALGIALVCGCSAIAALLEVLLIPTRWGATIAPVTIVAMLVGNLGLPRLMREINPAAWAVSLPAAIWLVVVLVLWLLPRPEGDVLVPGYGDDQYVATGLLFGGCVAAVAGILLNQPARPRAQGPSRPLSSRR